MHETNREDELDRPFPILGYVAVNAAVWIFCLLQVLIVRFLLGDLMGVIFFSIAIPVAFGFVSIFDAVFDRLSRAKSAKKPSADPNAGS